jgi:predicted Rossmann-fold nucleotide-binding protein
VRVLEVLTLRVAPKHVPVVFNWEGKGHWANPWVAISSTANRGFIFIQFRCRRHSVPDARK